MQAGGSSALLMDLAANEKSVHSDFFNGMTIESSCLYIQIIYKLGWNHLDSWGLTLRDSQFLKDLLGYNFVHFFQMCYK